MRIALVCPYNMFRGGGVQEVVLALRDGIRAHGHEAYIITPQPNGHKSLEEDGFILLGSSVPFRASRTEGAISASFDTDQINKILDEHKFDIVHFHEPWNPMISRQILTRSKAINIGTFHAAMSERRTSRTVERVITPYTKSILKYLDYMTAVSPTATNYMRTLTRRNATIIPNGIDLKKYKVGPGKGSDPKHKTVFYVGRLEKRKGLKYLIEAFALVKEKRPEFKLIIAGDGPEREKLESLVDELQVRDVEFLGYVDERTKLKLFHESDLFCSPALYGESFGIVLLEAMACGLVTVAGNNGGYQNVLKDRGQLSIVNPKDSEEFARRIILLATDQTLRKAWREWALEEVAKYDYEKVIDQYLAFYEAAVKQEA